MEVFLLVVVGGGSIFTKSDLKGKKQEKILGCSFFVQRMFKQIMTIKRMFAMMLMNRKHIKVTERG